MNSILHRISVVYYLIKVTVQSNLVYAKKTLFQVLQSIFSLYALVFVWYALKNAELSGGQALGSLITYTVVSTLLGIILPTDHISVRFEQDIGSGNISNKLLRPISVDWLNISQSVGTMLVSIVTKGIPVFLIALFFRPLYVPAHGYTWLIFVVSLILGMLIYFLIDLIGGYLCFWFYYGGSIRHFFEAIFGAFSGKLIPLALMPLWFSKISYWTPARLVYNDPISIFSGMMSPKEYGDYFLRLFIWILGLLVVYKVLKKYSLKKIFIQGG